MSNKQILKGVTGFDRQQTMAVMPWMLSLMDELGVEPPSPLWSYSFKEFTFEIIEGAQSLWLSCRYPASGRVALRAAHCPHGDLRIVEIRQIGPDHAVEIQVSGNAES